jgi:hypothetical protein
MKVNKTNNSFNFEYKGHTYEVTFNYDKRAFVLDCQFDDRIENCDSILVFCDWKTFDTDLESCVVSKVQYFESKGVVFRESTETPDFVKDLEVDFDTDFSLYDNYDEGE